VAPRRCWACPHDVQIAEESSVFDKILGICQTERTMRRTVYLPRIPGFGELLRNRRNALGVTLSELGQACEVDPSDLSRWEAKRRKPPERPVVVGICRALGLAPDEEEARQLLAAAERERYEGRKETDLLDVARYRPKVRAIPLHKNPVLTATDELELIEQLIKVVRKEGWNKVTMRLPGRVIQEIVREDLVVGEEPTVTPRRRRR